MLYGGGRSSCIVHVNNVGPLHPLDATLIREARLQGGRGGVCGGFDGGQHYWSDLGVFVVVGGVHEST